MRVSDVIGAAATAMTPMPEAPVAPAPKQKTAGGLSFQDQFRMSLVRPGVRETVLGLGGGAVGAFLWRDEHPVLGFLTGSTLSHVPDFFDDKKRVTALCGVATTAAGVGAALYYRDRSPMVRAAAYLAASIAASVGLSFVPGNQRNAAFMEEMAASMRKPKPSAQIPAKSTVPQAEAEAEAA